MSTQVKPKTPPAEPPKEEPEETVSAAQEKIEESKEVLESIVPNKEAKEWTFGIGENQIKLVQRPMSYFQKVEWFSLLAEAIDKTMTNSNTSVSDLLSGVNITGVSGSRQLSVSDFATADNFVITIAKMTQEMPDFLEESYCMWLGVARENREYVKMVLRQPVEQGGLSDDDGFEIMERFLDQNIGAIESFFVERVPKIGKRAQALLSSNNDKKKKQPRR